MMHLPLLYCLAIRCSHCNGHDDQRGQEPVGPVGELTHSAWLEHCSLPVDWTPACRFEYPHGTELLVLRGSLRQYLSYN